MSEGAACPRQTAPMLINLPCDPRDREEWIRRPEQLKHLNLAEYIEYRKSGPKAIETGRERTQQETVSAKRPQHQSGKMNGLEKRYAAHLELRKMTGEIADWKFEPLKLKLAPATFYSPDFALLMKDGTIELHETKGHWEDDARVKIKVSAPIFYGWFRLVGVRELTRGKSDWVFEEFRTE